MSRGRKILIVAITCVVLGLVVACALLRSCTVMPAPDREQETTMQTNAETEDDPKPDVQESTAPGETTVPTEGDDDTVKDEGQVSKPEENVQPPVEVIPDPDPEQFGLQFPCEVPGHHLKLEKLAPYTGLFVEDGTNVQVTDVAMILVQNTGTDALEYTEITVKYAEGTLVFQITALPAGERMVVQEKTGKKIPAGDPLEASALVVHRSQMAIAPELTVQDNSDNSLTITNLTDQIIPIVRVFYKYYMEKEDLYVGGIAFSVRITNLPANGSIVVQPAHFVSASSRVVMASTYDLEV